MVTGPTLIQHDIMLTQLCLQRTYFQIRLYFELQVDMNLGENTIQLTTEHIVEQIARPVDSCNTVFINAVLTWLEALVRGQLVPLLEQPIKATPPTTSFMGSHTLGHHPPALITSRPGTSQLGTAPMSLSPLKLFRLANPKPGYPALSIPTRGKNV